MHTVGDLLRRLQEFDSLLPIALADWNEGYQCPINDFSAIVQTDVVITVLADDGSYSDCVVPRAVVLGIEEDE